MANRFTNPAPQFFDNSGLPLTGGTLGFYLTGTTTLATIYTDRALSIPAQNPIPLDSAGRTQTNVFLDPAVTYKAILASSAGTVIWTKDPVVDLAANISASVAVVSGNPNGQRAGSAGTIGGLSASMVFDIVNNILYFCTTTGSVSSAVWTAPTINNTLTGNEDIVAASTYTLVLADVGRIKTANNAAGAAWALTAASTIGAGKLFGIKNIGAGTLVLTPNGSDKIEFASTFSLTQNQGAIIYCTGSAWRVLCSYTVGSSPGDLLAYSADPGATVGPNVVLFRDSASPAVSDLIGQILWNGRNSAAAVKAYASIVPIITDPTAATEDAQLQFNTQVAGTLSTILTLGPGAQVGSPTGGDKGAASLNVAGGIWDNGLRVGNGAIPTQMTASGRLSLTTATPVMTADVSGATTVFWCLYGGSFYPSFDGTNWTLRSIAELSLALDSNAGHTGYAQSGKNFDFFLMNDAGTDRLVTGPAWSSDTARAQAISQVNGVYVNTASMTVKFDTSASTKTVAASQGTYVGTMRATANGQTSMVMNPAAASGGALATLGLWNYYNRRLHYAWSRDNGASYTYATATTRQARASANNQVNFISGLAEDAIGVSARYDFVTLAVANATLIGGFALDVTNNNSVDQYRVFVSSVIAFDRNNLTTSIDKQIGYHFVAKIEKGDGANANTFNANSGDSLTINMWC